MKTKIIVVDKQEARKILLENSNVSTNDKDFLSTNPVYSEIAKLFKSNFDLVLMTEHDYGKLEDKYILDGIEIYVYDFTSEEFVINSERQTKVEDYQKWLKKAADEKKLAKEKVSNFLESNKDKKLNVFLVEELEEEIDGWGGPTSERKSYFVYVSNKKKIDFKKELSKSTEDERDPVNYTSEEKISLVKEGENSYSITKEYSDDPWVKITYTLSGQREHEVPFLHEILRFGSKDVDQIGKTGIMNLDIEVDKKNSLFFDPSSLAKEITVNLKFLKEPELDILFKEAKKVLGF